MKKIALLDLGGNPAFFERLLVELKDVDVESLLFIDDSKRKIERAAQHGITGILFENNVWRDIRSFENFGCLFPKGKKKTLLPCQTE